MNSLKIQFKALIFKNCVLLSLFMFLVFPALKAQSLADTNNAENLYTNAKVLYTTGDFDNAIKKLNKILLLKDKISKDTKPEYFKVYNRLGLVYKKQGNLNKAIEFYEKAIDYTIDEYTHAIIKGNIANIYSETGDYVKAISYFEKSLLILKNSKHTDKYQRIINNYLNQGHAFYKSGQINLALEKDLECIHLAKENNLNEDGSKFYNTGLAYQALDSLSKADYYFKEAINTYIRNFGKNYYMTAMAYMNHAIFCAEIGKYNISEQLYLKAYKIFINSLGRNHLYTAYCLKNIGNLYTKKGNYKEALNYYQKSLASKINNFNDSSIYINPSSNVFPDLDLLDVLKAKAQALEMLATREHKETNLKAALSTLELTVKFIEQLRMGYLYEDSKLLLAEKEHESYLDIIEICYELLDITDNNDYINIAFKYSERSKYAILRESINEESARNNASIPDSILLWEKTVKEQIGNIRIQLENENKLVNPDSLKQVKLKESLFQLTLSQEKIIRDFEINYPQYYKRKYENSVVSINELQSQLSEKESIISYELTDSNLYTFLVTNKTQIFNKIKLDTMFFEHFEIYQEFLHSQSELGYVKFRIASYELYKTLIKPIEIQLKGKNLLIIPDSKMSLIALESLITEPYKKQQFADYATEPYLLVKYPIAYTYSATLYFNSLQKKKRWNPKFLGFAPDYINSRDSLDPMPLAIKNIKEISRFIRGKVFTGENATESNLKRNYKKYGILHLYAHGNEDLENPQFSKIYLSHRNDTIEDSYLHAYEIDELNIEADMVVLASCYSGSGTINKSEGALSIGRRFLNAGNPSLLISLWTATYEPTLFELKEFYKYLVLGKRKDEALRLAKLKYLKSANPLEANPRYWTSLIIVGNQDALFKAYIFSKIFFLLTIIGMVYFIFKSKKRLTRRKNKLS